MIALAALLAAGSGRGSPTIAREIPAAAVSHAKIKHFPWVVLNVRQDRTGLLVQYYEGGCYLQPANVRVHETARAVRISISLPAAPEGKPCPAAGLSRKTLVELSSSLAGQAILGPDRAFTEPGYGAAAYRTVPGGDRLVPSVLGLAPADAEWVLHAQGFRTTLSDPTERQIVAQDPAADSVAPEQNDPNHGLVRLTAGSS